MEVRTGLDNIRAFIRSVEHCHGERWDAFDRHLYQPFRRVWDAWFATFGWCAPGSEDARQLVNSIRLKRCEEQLDRFQDDGAVGIIQDTLREAEDLCPPAEAAGAFVLLGLGRTDGCVVLTDDGPALFLGLDTYPGKQRIADLVAHEYNHVVRLGSTVKAESSENDDTGLLGGMTVGDLTVAEGLAVAFPLRLRGEEVTRYAARDAGFMSTGAIESCLEKEDKIRENIFSCWHQPLSQRLMLRFFANLGDDDEGEMPAKTGYFLGARLVQRLLDRGKGICELTVAPTDCFYHTS